MMHKAKTDRELLQGITKGDIPSYEEAYRRYYPRLLSFVRGMLKDPLRAEDVAQNIFMRLWLCRESLDETLSLKNFLFISAKNEVFNIFKSKAYKSMLYKDSLPDSSLSGDSPHLDLEYAETSRQVAELIGRMPDRRREIFMMSRYGRKSVAEISQELQLSPRTVEKHIELALKDLRGTMS